MNSSRPQTNSLPKCCDPRNTRLFHWSWNTMTACMWRKYVTTACMWKYVIKWIVFRLKQTRCPNAAIREIHNHSIDFEIRWWLHAFEGNT
jgi:hypothetical protein